MQRFSGVPSGTSTADAGPTALILSRLVKVLFLVVGCVHFSACGWYMMCGIDDMHGYNISTDSWCISTWEPDFDVLRGVRERYLVAVYWAFVTVTTVGYGDISPTTLGTTVFTAVYILIGVSTMISRTGQLYDELAS